MSRGPGHRLPYQVIMQIAKLAHSGRTVREIAIEVDCSENAVRAIGKRFDIRFRTIKPRATPKWIVDSIANLAAAGWTALAISQHLAMSRKSVARLAKQHGIHIKKTSKKDSLPITPNPPKPSKWIPDKSFYYTCADCAQQYSAIPGNGIKHSPKMVIGGVPLCSLCTEKRALRRKVRIQTEGYL